MAVIVRSLSLFVLAGLCGIGGGYLVWLWLREGKGIFMGILGSVVLIMSGISRRFSQLISDGSTRAMVGSSLSSLSFGAG